MIRHLFVVAAVLTLATAAQGAGAARTRVAAQPEPEATMTLRALFELAPGVEVVETPNGEFAPAFAVEVVVARIGPDGKLIKACVDNQAAAERFFKAPIETIAAEAGQQ